MQTPSNVEDTPQRLLKAFDETFRTRPDFLVRAPGRVDLIGTHTDYNDGWVLPAAITRTVWLAVKALAGPRAVIKAVDMGENATVDLGEPTRIKSSIGRDLPAWVAYPAGVAWSLQESGLATSGCQIALASSVPVGAGLSSSAAVEVAYGLAWTHIAGHKVDKMKLAQMCQRAENQYVGVNSGLMDQFASLFGKADHALLFDCRTLEWEAVPLPSNVVLVIVDTGTRRSLSNSHYNERRADCEEAVRVLKTVLPDIRALRDVSPEAFEEYKHLIPVPPRHRAAHIIAENARVLAAAAALRKGDVAELGHLMDEAQISSRDLFDASGPEMNTMWQDSHGHPARLGGRFVGGGWAGCMVYLVKAEGSDDFADFLSRRYHKDTGITPTIYTMQAAEGAEVIAVESI